ncbi:MAG TPA: hypothetical protein VK993_12575 [Chthoniobacterales bacterium]|nr:hypothetical protein [Chthoniobacterales bacterium]
MIQASCTLALAILAASTEAGPQRTAVAVTPQIGERWVPRFVLMERVKVDRSGPGMRYNDLADLIVCELLPGQFVPVSQDADGVYYQASNGIRRLVRPNSVVHGGLYVNKTRPEKVLVYEGDARHHDAALKRDTINLARSQLAKLKVGQPAR